MSGELVQIQASASSVACKRLRRGVPFPAERWNPSQNVTTGMSTVRFYEQNTTTSVELRVIRTEPHKAWEAAGNDEFFQGTEVISPADQSSQLTSL